MREMNREQYLRKCRNKREAILSLVAKGKTYEQAGKRHGVSRQRVGMIVKQYRKEGA